MSKTDEKGGNVLDSLGALVHPLSWGLALAVLLILAFFGNFSERDRIIIAVISFAIILVLVKFAWFRLSRRTSESTKRQKPMLIIGTLAVLGTFTWAFWKLNPVASFEFKTTPDVGILICNFENQAGIEIQEDITSWGKYLEDEINNQVEILNQKYGDKQKIKIEARTIAKTISSHNAARELAGKIQQTKMVVWGTISRLANNTGINPRITMVDTTKPEYYWKEGPASEYNSTYYDINFPRQPVKTPLQLSLYLLTRSLDDSSELSIGLELLEEAANTPNQYQKHTSIIYGALASLYRTLRRYRDAFEYTVKSYQADPDSPEAQNDLAVVYMDSANVANDLVLYNKAEGILQKLLISDPKNRVATYNNLATVSMARQDTTETINRLRKAIEADSSVAFSFTNLAFMYFLCSEPDSAVKFSAQAYKMAPNEPIVVNTYAGILLEVKQDTLKALEIWEKAIKEFPYYVEFYLQSGHTSAILGEPEKALEYFETGAKYANDQTLFKIGKAGALSALGKTEIAFKLLEEAVAGFAGDDPMQREAFLQYTHWVFDGKSFKNIRQHSRWPRLLDQITETNKKYYSPAQLSQYQN